MLSSWIKVLKTWDESFIHDLPVHWTLSDLKSEQDLQWPPCLKIYLTCMLFTLGYLIKGLCLNYFLLPSENKQQQMQIMEYNIIEYEHASFLDIGNIYIIEE